MSEGTSGALEPRQDWSLARRIAFRFACAYFGIYFIGAVLGLLPGNGLGLWTRYVGFKRWLVPWVGAHVLGLAQPITVFPAGSGDTTYNYVEVLCYAAFALAVTVAWSLLSRARAHPRAHAALRLQLRYVVGITMLGYGMAKVIKTQFPFPSVDTLLQAYGDASPMGLLWTFMGASKGYNLFVGTGEVLAGLLLFYRRTTTLGALLVLGVMSNVAALNFCYDTPVKLYSSHLLLAGAFLVLPDTARLWNVLVANRTAPPAPRPALAKSWMERLRPVVATAFLAWVLQGQVRFQLQAYGNGDGKPRSPLHGAYDVLAFSIDDQEIPVSDARHWTTATFDTWGYFSARTATGYAGSWRFEPAASGETVKLFPGQDDQGAFELETVWNDPEHLDLAGELNGKLLVVQLQKKSFLLETRGFHWVNETPFNR